MKGKLGLLCGLAIGYVLGSRAGRQRYEQIKSGAKRVWESAPVYRGRKKVKGYAGEKLTGVQNFVIGKGKQVLHAATKPDSDQD